MSSETEMPEAAESAEPPTQSSPPAPSAWRRWARRLLWAVCAVLLLWGLLWLAVPPLLQWQGQKIASQELGRPTRIGKVDFRPWSLELTVHDLAVGGVAGAPDQFTVKRLYLDASWQSLWRLGPVLNALQVDDPALRLTHLGEGRYDIDDILARLAAQAQPTQPSRPLHFALYNSVLRGGRIDFDDRAVDRVQEVRDLHLALPFISNLPSAREVEVQPQLAFRLNGSGFDSQTQVLPFAPSRQTDASVQLAHIDLKPYLGYLPADLPLRLQAGTVDADLRLAFEQTPKPSLRVTGSLMLSALKAVDRQGADALAFDALELQLAELRPLERKLHLASVKLTGPQLTVRRSRDGRIDLLSPSAASSASDSVADKPAEADALTLRIDQLAVHGGSLNWQDDSTAREHVPAAAVRLENLEVSASSIAYPLQQLFDFEGSTTLAAAASADSAAAPAAASAASVAAAAAAAGSATDSAMGSTTAPAAHAAGAALKFAGRVSTARGEVGVQVASVPLALAGPYLAPYLVPRLDGTLDADASLQWAPPREQDATPAWSVTARRVQLSQLQLSGEGARVSRRSRNPDTPADELARIEKLELADVQLDPQGRTVTVGRLAVQGPRVVVERDAHRRWMAERWLPGSETAPTEAPAHSKPAAREQGPANTPWAVRINEFALAGGTVGWRDEVMARPVRAEVTDLRMEGRKLDLMGKEPMELELSARLGTGRRSGGEPGRLSWRGQLAQAPLSARGRVDAERLPLQAFEPYFGERLNIRVLRADTSFKGRVDFAETARGPRVRVEGDARVDELRTHSRPGTAANVKSASVESAEAARPASAAPAASRAPLAPVAEGTSAGLGEELLSWKQLRLDGLDVRLTPDRAPQVTIGSTQLSDFFARIAIDPSGRINLQDIVKSDDQAPSASPATAAAGTPVSEASDEAPGPAAARTEPEVDPLAPIIHFGPTRLVGGHIDFSDHFIRPNYSADLTALDGTLGAFSSVAPGAEPQMAELSLSGMAQGTATLGVHGRINPLAHPLALDIQAKMTDLDLPPLSPYSVKYAGHGIERGKLSMDVAYRIQPDGQLTATNKLVLNQLEFGAPVEGAPASLPVQLATALLADSHGVIDLDLPISGSINDPQFSLGHVIFKGIVNLIGKAITAPFTLLARALGGSDSGQDLSKVAFAAGSAQLSAAARTQLDRVAKALADRPGLELTVIGSARLSPEIEGARRQRLDALVAAEQRSGAPAASAPAPASTSAAQAEATDANAAAAGPDAGASITASPEYPALLKRLYRRADIPGKPRNAIGMLRDIPVADMEKALMAHIDVNENDIRQLAVKRAVAVKDYLAGKGVAAARLFLGAVKTDATPSSGTATPSASDANPGTAEAWVPHAELSLGMK
ncbi:MAG: DUF748 domain-containing protein [Burkholderiaceae bacterium]|nr:DUF748 domain-containing protein [Burkholderiaceae bacterium]